MIYCCCDNQLLLMQVSSLDVVDVFSTVASNSISGSGSVSGSISNGNATIILFLIIS